MSKVLRLTEAQLLAIAPARVRGPVAVDVAADTSARVSGGQAGAGQAGGTAGGNDPAALNEVMLPVIRFCKKCQCETERKKSGACKPCCAAWSAANRDRGRESEAKYRERNKQKRKDAKAKYRQENAEKIAAQSAIYYQKTKDARLAASRCWASKNKERKAATTSTWSALNRVKARGYSAKWRENNPEKVREKRAIWNRSNPDKCRVYSHNRRAKKRESGGKLSPDIAKRLFKLQRGKCACCGIPLGDDYHLDHIIPLELGGSNNDCNVQLLRTSCNLKKGARHPVEFMQSRGFLL